MEKHRYGGGRKGGEGADSGRRKMREREEEN